MRALSKILLPVDFSERSMGAARYARSLADHFQTELILLHVLTPQQYEFGAMEVAGSMLTELYRSRFDHASREMNAFMAAELSGVRVQRVVKEGDPARTIVQFSQELPADVILMPTHGYGPFRRFILGSNTAKVLHDADCPVWTGVHLEETPAAASIPLRNILCAVDLGPQSEKTLCWASGLARSFGAHLTLMHVTAGVADAADRAEASWLQSVRDAASLELGRLGQASGAEGKILIEAGEVAQVICSAAVRIPADVLVVGRGSAAGVFGRLRTNAYAIIRQSPCPVVSV
jgi:nucleotide-binding universal stress UspA family protein